MIEILHVRDPDSECSLRVWVDGKEVTNFTFEDIDPGRGYTVTAWEAGTNSLLAAEGLSDGFREAAAAERDSARDSAHIREALR